MDDKRMDDSDGVSTLMYANLLAVFGQRDPGLRREAMGRTYAEEIVFTDQRGLSTVRRSGRAGAQSPR